MNVVGKKYERINFFEDDKRPNTFCNSCKSCRNKISSDLKMTINSKTLIKLSEAVFYTCKQRQTSADLIDSGVNANAVNETIAMK